MTSLTRIHSIVEHAIASSYSTYENYMKTKERVIAAPKICIFGLGDLFFDFSRVVFQELFSKMNIVCVSDFDEKKWGKDFIGVPCVPPQELAQMEGLIVLITADDFLAVKANLEKMSLESYFIGDCYAGYFDQPCKKDWIENAKSDIIKAYTLLEDERSKEIYTELLCQKIAPELATQEFYKLCEADEYYYKDFIHLTENECFVDCGAYIGDTVESFLRQVDGKYESIVAFEPDIQNYAVARKMINDRQLERVSLYNCGLSDENSHSVAELLAVSHGDEIPVPTELPADSMVAVNIKKIATDVRFGRLDDLLKGNRVTFLKIDVEGFEKKMLKGATGVIGAQKPKIALCIYHQTHDLWTLPLMLHEIRPDYKLHIRHHSSMGYDTVCYAV